VDETETATAYGQDVDAAAFYLLMRRYHDALLEHHLMPDI